VSTGRRACQPARTAQCARLVMLLEHNRFVLSLSVNNVTLSNMLSSLALLQPKPLAGVLQW
jgi:hypothetical protein